MTWIRIDDSFADHPKILHAGPFAIAIQVRALCYASRHLTDGRLTQAALPALLLGVGPGEWPETMIACGLWHRDGKDYLIHDYLKYNPSRRKVMQLRAIKRKSGQAGGQASAQARAQAPAWPSGSEVLNSHPLPSPSPETKKEGRKKAPRVAYGHAPTRQGILQEIRHLRTNPAQITRLKELAPTVDIPAALLRLEGWVEVTAKDHRIRRIRDVWRTAVVWCQGERRPVGRQTPDETPPYLTLITQKAVAT